MNEPILLDAGDVHVLPFERDECEGGCDDGIVTHYVSLDMRGNGATHEVGRYCEPCAEDFAQRLRDSLPAERP